MLASYAQGASIDEPLASLSAAGTVFFEADGLGSITSLSGMAGITDTYTYNAFGVTTTTGGNPNRFRYTGREWDPETGLYYYRARYYDPQSGRFISEDPIEFAGAMNFYAYVHNTPTNLVDPGGMSDACTFGNCGNRPRPPAPPPPPDLGGNINALGGIFPGSTPGPGKPPWSLFIPLPCDDVEKVLHAQGYITWDNWPYEFYNPLILWDPAAHSGGSEARTPGSGFHFRIHPDKLPCGKEGCTLDQFHMDLFNPIDHPIKHGMEFVGWALGKLLN